MIVVRLRLDWTFLTSIKPKTIIRSFEFTNCVQMDLKYKNQMRICCVISNTWKSNWIYYSLIFFLELDIQIHIQWWFSAIRNLIVYLQGRHLWMHCINSTTTYSIDFEILYTPIKVVVFFFYWMDWPMPDGLSRYSEVRYTCLTKNVMCEHDAIPIQCDQISFIYPFRYSSNSQPMVVEFDANLYSMLF